MLTVKIQLPNGDKITLDNNKTLEEKQAIVDELTTEWAEQIQSNWDSNSIRFFLDNLANYLVWHKELEDVGKEDKDVMSIKKVEEMSGKRKSKSIPFTSLSKPQRESLGFEGVSSNDT